MTPQPPGRTLKLTPLELGSLGGFGLAIVSTFLVWLKDVQIGNQSAWKTEQVQFGSGPWHSFYFLESIVAPSHPSDAIAVVLLAVAGVYLILAPQNGWRTPSNRYAIAWAGGLLVLLGVLEVAHISDIGGGIGVGSGVFLLIISGAAAAGCAYKLEQDREKAASPLPSTEPAASEEPKDVPPEAPGPAI
jgi:hypothetical protein